MKRKNQRCQVYLIHFEKPYYHAQHYIGFSSDLARRLFEHDSDQGSRLIAAINAIGIDWQVVRTWDVPAYEEGGLDFELKLKRMKNARLLCPLCYEQTADRRARLARRRRRGAQSGNQRKPKQLKLPFMAGRRKFAVFNRVAEKGDLLMPYFIDGKKFEPNPSSYFPTSMLRDVNPQDEAAFIKIVETIKSCPACSKAEGLNGPYRNPQKYPGILIDCRLHTCGAIYSIRDDVVIDYLWGTAEQTKKALSLPDGYKWCKRCSGRGLHSYHRRRGRVCIGCKGRGFVPLKQK